MSAEYADYLFDESRTMGSADFIAFPANEAELAEVIRRCAEDGIPLTAQGALTGLAGGASPERGLVLNLQRMNRILGMRKDADGTVYVRVQPGLRLAQLRRALAVKAFDVRGWDGQSVEVLKEIRPGQLFFPPDPTETTASIGGMTACNASGARTYRYGATRKHVEGLRVILADGRSVTLRRGEQMAAGRCLRLRCDDGSLVFLPLPFYRMPSVKNASGYFIEYGMDAVDLFAGSDGTLGVITEILLRLTPLPAQIWECGLLLKTEAHALELTDALRRNCSRLASIEFFDAGALRVLKDRKARDASLRGIADVPDDVQSLLFVEIHADSKEEAFGELERVTACLKDCGGDPDRTWFGWNSAQIARFKEFRHAVPESVNMLIDERRKTYPQITKLGTDMSVEDKDLKRVFAMYREGLVELGLQSAIWGHIGNNHVHVNILPRDPDDYRRGKEL